MSYVAERVAYLKGLAEGLKIQQDKDENQLLLKVIEVLEDVADSIDILEEEQDTMSEVLNEVAEFVLGDGPMGHAHPHPSDDEDVVEYNCPHCGVTVFFDKDAFADISDDIQCPECGLNIFPKSELPES